MIAIVFAVYTLVIFYRKNEKNNMTGSMLFLCLTIYFIVWLPWIFSPRIMFMYHYLPAIPFASILVGYMLTNIKKELAFLCSVLILSGFIFIYPQVTGIHLQNKIKRSYYDETINKKMLDYVFDLKKE